MKDIHIFFSVSPNILQKGKVPILSARKCRSLHDNGSVTSRMLCAGFKAGGTDTCQGDSGDPWFVEYVVRNLRFYLKQYKPDVVQLYVYVFSSVL